MEPKNSTSNPRPQGDQSKNQTGKRDGGQTKKGGKK